MRTVQGLRYRWQIADLAPRELFGTLNGVHPAVAQSLFVRGYHTASAVNDFLRTDGLRPIESSPWALKGMEEAVHRLVGALRAGEKIAVFGDYDADGVNAAAVLWEGLRLFGFTPLIHLPNRFEEGYGISKAGVDALRRNGVSLIITADCGVTANDVVEHASRHGVDIIITDHHLPSGTLPPAVAVIDPHRVDCGYPFKGICGATVAFKLLEGLAQVVNHQGADSILSLLDMLALATVADVASLRDAENRYLVKAGLTLINSRPRPGILALLHSAGLEIGKVTCEDLGYKLGPRINAAGRMDDPTIAYKLLVARDDASALSLASQLGELNQQRQQLTESILEIASQETERQLNEGRVSLVLAGDKWPRGVIGLVASKLAEYYNRPTLVISCERDACYGSGRSIRKLHLREALSDCSHILQQFGGHRQACGFNLSRKRLDELSATFDEACRRRLSQDDLIPVLDVDGFIPLNRLDLTMVDAVSAIAPFGQDFDEPVYAVGGVVLKESRSVGKGHWRVIAGQGRTAVAGIGFGLGAFASQLRVGDRANLAFRVSKNVWQDCVSAEMRLLDACPA